MQRKISIWIGFLCGLVAGVVITLVLWRGPSSTSAAAGNLVVLCSTCDYEGLDRRGNRLTLLDTNTGDIWVYTDEAMAGRAKPIRWGKFTLGQPVSRFTPNQ